MNRWGLLPDDVLAQLRTREWLNAENLRGRLSGDRPFPIRIALKAPTGAQALADLERFRRFVESWKHWPNQSQVDWQTKKFQQLGEQMLPVAVQIDSMRALIEILGPKAEARKQRWEQLMRPLLNLDVRLSTVLIKQLSVLESMAPDDSALLAQLLPQLHRGMGQGAYLRALPLKGVDTKFVETYQGLIEALADRLHEGEVTEQGGLSNWLACNANPSGWLLVRPLCRQSRERLAGLPILQMDTRTLQSHALPAGRILVVENKQSGYALPELDDTIAVFGGGRNTAWMEAAWLRQKRMTYWGDIDSWGLTILSDARRRQPHLRALMMDEMTVLEHRNRMVEEDSPQLRLPEYLTEAERQLFERLQNRHYERTRLEQERLAPDYIRACLLGWH
ncbi:MAG: hypothetical protein CVV06_18795 [Gammaproteobacteria bacterium HGW-Gammaproteobacteria-10]|nr:MAG: hypothetical protein CVV06_18795 [Gammaproteobacteria bacterium HGW-Gammaproteobacteria-10]